MEVDPSAVPNGGSVVNGASGGNQNGVIANGSSVESSVDNPVEVSSKKSSQGNDSNGSGIDESEYSKIEHEEANKACTLPELMENMRSVQYQQDVGIGYVVLAKCKWLFEKDYQIRAVRSHVTPNYPTEIIVPIARVGELYSENIVFDSELYGELAKEAHVARIHSRVAAPVILFDDKLICRSSTLTVWQSAMFEVFKKTKKVCQSVCGPPSQGFFSYALDFSFEYAEAFFSTAHNLLWQPIVMDKLFETDAKILKLLNVGHICDLMVEFNKIYKQQLTVSGSERVNEKFYSDFKIKDMPYPGCEFFTKYSEANRNPEGLMFDWSQEDVKRELDLKGDTVCSPPIDTLNFKEWDLVELTGKYLKIMLWYLVTSEAKGILVHCISGWDRTPLFISLLRLSLWADGVVHKSLDYEGIAFLTVAYDWFLFGHNLPNRLLKKEEIMHFCFNFLQYITSDEFSVTRMFSELPEEQRGNRQFPNFTPGRRMDLDKVRALVLDTYESSVVRPKTD